MTKFDHKAKYDRMAKFDFKVKSDHGTKFVNNFNLLCNQILPKDQI